MSLRVTELIAKLKKIDQEHGDLTIVGGYLTDDSGLSDVIVINEYGCDIKEEGGDVAGVFLNA